MNAIHSRIAGTVAAILIATAAAGNAMAQDVTFKGKTINVIIGTTPGGGTDGTTRLVGRFLEKYLPGNPRMNYRNMPGGGGVKGTTYFANVVKRDGSAWMGGGTGYVHHQTLRLDVARYDPRTFNFIGGINRGGSLLHLRKTKHANLKDKSMKPAIFGSQDGTGTYEGLLMWSSELLDWNFRFVVGYPGTPSMVLAMRRGEIDGYGTSNSFQIRSLYKTGKFASLTQIGQLRDGKIHPRSSFPNIPTLDSLAKGKFTGLAKRSFDFWYVTTQVDKWYALPPKTPAKIVAVYRKAFKRAFADPEFVKAGKHQFSEDFAMQTAEDLTDVINRGSYPSAELKDYAVKLRVKYGLPAKPLSEKELAALAKKLVKSKTVTSVLKDIKRGGRRLFFKVGAETHKVAVSGRRTKVFIGGKKTKRKNLKVGMSCKITYPENGGEAQKIDCKK